MGGMLGLSLPGHLTYSTWHFEAIATQTVSADLIQHQKDHCLAPHSPPPPVFFEIDYRMQLSLHSKQFL